MALIKIVREVPLTARESWDRLVDWKRHGDFVPLTTIALTANGFDAFTGLGRLGFHDPMDVVQSREPSFCRLEKRGRMVKGWAELSVESHGDGSRVTWREEVKLAGVPRAFDPVTRWAGSRLFSRVVDGLLS